MTKVMDIYSRTKDMAQCQICGQDTVRYLVLGGPICNNCNTKSPVNNQGNNKKS